MIEEIRNKESESNEIFEEVTDFFEDIEKEEIVEEIKNLKIMKMNTEGLI